MVKIGIFKKKWNLKGGVSSSTNSKVLTIGHQIEAIKKRKNDSKNRDFDSVDPWGDVAANAVRAVCSLVRSALDASLIWLIFSDDVLFDQTRVPDQNKTRRKRRLEKVCSYAYLVLPGEESIDSRF